MDINMYVVGDVLVLLDQWCKMESMESEGDGDEDEDGNSSSVGVTGPCAAGGGTWS